MAKPKTQCGAQISFDVPNEGFFATCDEVPDHGKVEGTKAHCGPMNQKGEILYDCPTCKGHTRAEVKARVTWEDPKHG